MRSGGENDERELVMPDPGSDDPRDDPFPNEPTPDVAVLPLSEDGDARVERSGFGADPADAADAP